MKLKYLISPVLLAMLIGCSSPSTDSNEPVSTGAAPITPADSSMKPAMRASATGKVQSVDPAARTVTIAHGPVAALKWPAMTMTFKGPDADLAAINPGDEVSFEFTSTGMDGTITAISHN